MKKKLIEFDFANVATDADASASAKRGAAKSVRKSKKLASAVNRKRKPGATCAEIFVHFDASLFIELDADFFRAQAV